VQNADPVTESFVHIDRPYLLVTNIPYFTDAAGDVFLEKLWHHDLVRHTTYLPRLLLAAPALPKPPNGDWVRVEEPVRSAIRFVPLPAQPSFKDAVLALPRTFAGLFGAVGSADIVHIGVAGWPIPLGWIAGLLAKMRGRRLVVLVESAPWRLSGGSQPSRKARVRGTLNEFVARFVCRNADLGFFTHPLYLKSLHGNGRGPAYVTPATWIDDENVLERERAIAIWRKKREGSPRFLFAGRMHPDKGVLVLLEALRILDERGVGVHLDFIGTGSLTEQVDAAIARFQHVRAERLTPVAYGTPFFELLDGYHALVVPSLADEQPRLVFDAPARAVPLIAANTDGIRPHVEPERTGVLVERGDAPALADALARLSANPNRLETMGLAALEEARSHTHTAMHVTRSQLLARHLARSR